MDLIEQAVFTSAETSRASGYQVVATSPGVGEADARELATWGPSHDALLEPGPQALSLNFHPLPSGAYCVSRTTPSGFEYSGRGGVRVYTQCLVVPPAVLARFANNPFSLVRAATANGSLRQYDKVPSHLEPIRLAGRTPPVDSALLSRLCTNPGPEWMASLIQAMLESVTVAIVGGPPAEQLIAGLINCLPVECRADFSFSTGLKFSSRRPFRLVALAADPEEQRRIERLYNVAVLRIGSEIPAAFTPVESWPRLIHRVLKCGRTSFLAARLARRHLGFSSQDLPLFGLQLLEELDATAMETDTPGKEPVGDATGDEAANLDETVSPESGENPSPAGPRYVREPSGPRADQRKAHAPHPQFQKGSGAAASPKRPADSPSKHLDPDNPQVLEKLERLDDVVFEAISGNAEAAEQLKTLWPAVLSELGERLVAESREQYLRYALSIWNEFQEPDGTRTPARAAQSLDVLCVLFDQV